MPQPCIFSFDSGHVGFANNLISIRDKARVDRPAIGNIKIALPLVNTIP